MKLYLSGPMAGYPDLNYPAFHALAMRLRDAGYDVINPAELHPEDAGDWKSCLRTDLIVMLSEKCDAIVVMEGWEKSRGARLEVDVCHKLGIPVINVGKLLDATLSDGVVREILGNAEHNTEVAA